MKRAQFKFLFIGLIIIILVNVALPGFLKNNVDVYDLLFLNIANFEYYYLDPIDFQYIISFTLLYELAINYILSNYNDTNSFIYLILARTGILKGYFIFLKEYLKKISIAFILIFFITILFNYKLAFIHFIYLIKYFAIVFLILFILSICLINNSKKYSMNLLNIIYLIFLMFDLFFKTYFITYSGNIVIELKYLFVTSLMLFAAIIYVICNKRGVIE